MTMVDLGSDCRMLDGALQTSKELWALDQEEFRRWIHLVARRGSLCRQCLLSLARWRMDRTGRWNDSRAQYRNQSFGHLALFGFLSPTGLRLEYWIRVGDFVRICGWTHLVQNEAHSVELDSAVLRTFTTPNQPYNPLEKGKAVNRFRWRNCL